MVYKGYKDLIAYQKSRLLSREIFILSQSFPNDEKYSLTDQIRRSSRSIGANIAESWPKRKYIKAFISKLIDAQSEGCETIHWLDIAEECGYVSSAKNEEVINIALEVQRLVEGIIRNPEKFCY